MTDVPEISACTKCGKLYVPTVFDHRKCPACVAEHEKKIFLVENAIYRALIQTVEGIVEYTQLAEDEVVRILKSLHYLNESVTGHNLCTRCRKNDVQAGSQFCAKCRFELHEAIGRAAGAIGAKIGREAYRPTDALPLHNVLAEVEKKRLRTSADTIRPRQTKIK